MRHGGSRKRFSLSVQSVLVLCLASAAIGFLMLNLPTKLDYHDDISEGIDYGGSDNSSEIVDDVSLDNGVEIQSRTVGNSRSSSCATVEEMGATFREGTVQESLRVRKIIQDHFDLNGASKVGRLPPDQFCRHGFVMAKASEAGFGNEMYKILTSAALSIMLNRSLIIGQTRHIGEGSLLGSTFPIRTFLLL